MMSARLPDDALQPIEFTPTSVAAESVRRACEVADQDGYWRGYEARGRDNLLAGACWGLMAGVFLVAGAIGAGFHF